MRCPRLYSQNCISTLFPPFFSFFLEVPNEKKEIVALPLLFFSYLALVIFHSYQIKQGLNSKKEKKKRPERPSSLTTLHYKQYSCEGSEEIITVTQLVHKHVSGAADLEARSRDAASRHFKLWHVVSLLLISISAHRWQMRLWQVSVRSRAGLVTRSAPPHAVWEKTHTLIYRDYK